MSPSTSAATAVGIVLQSSDDDPFLLIVGGFVLGLFLVYHGFGLWKRARLIEDTPTEKVRSVAVGRTELEGTVAEYERSVEPAYHDEDCVYVDWEAERYDDTGDNEGWRTVADGTEALPFYLDDGTGRMLVRADRDEPTVDIQDDPHTYRRTFGTGESPPEAVSAYVDRYRKRGESGTAEAADGALDQAMETVSELGASGDPLGATTDRRRFTQRVLPVGADAYVFGAATEREEAGTEGGQERKLALGRDGSMDEFLIADASGERLEERYSKRGPLEIAGGLLLSAVALYFFLLEYGVPFA